MALYSEAELDIKAKATVYSLERNLVHFNIVKGMLAHYKEFCEGSEAKKLSIKPRQITEGIELRLVFELLCFAVFITSRTVAKYIATRKLIVKKTNYPLVDYYNNRVSQHLTKLCQDLGMTKLREIVLISPPPHIKIKYGDSLHPLLRLTEYSKCHSTKKGSEVQHFGRHISKALDPYNYPILERLWNEEITTLTKLVARVIAEIFKPSITLRT
jgi:hypothetical protein